MRVFFFLFFTVSSLFINYLQAQTYVFGQLSGSPLMSTAGWSLNGNATIGDTPGDVDNFLNELILTNAFDTQSGGIFYNTPINLSICQKWSVEFEYRIWGGDAADGLAFCFLSDPPTGFVNGGGIGIPEMADGLKVVIDTYDNCDQGGTNPEIQIFNGIGYDECLPGTPKVQNSFVSLSYLRNLNYQPVKITYDNGVITVFVNNVQLLTTNLGINYTGYMGFTASTGGQNDQHSIRNVIIYTDQAQSNAGVDVSTCSNGGVAIGAAPNSSNIYNWSPAMGLSSTSVANPIVTLPNTTGAPITQTYTVTTSLASAPGLCPTTDQIVVTIQPEYSLDTNLTACSGQYIFDGQVLTQSGIYNATLITTHGCDSIVTLDLTIVPSPSANAGPNQTICSGESGSIGALTQSGLIYNWTPSSGLSATNIANPTAQLSNINLGGPIVQTYTLTVTDTSNTMACTATDQIDLTILPAYQTLIQDTLCNGGPFIYNGNTYAQTGVYIDSSSTTGGCDSITTIQIAISQTPIFDINDTLICLGTQVDILPVSNFSNITYAWLAPNTTLPIFSQQLVVSPAQTTTYQVTAIDTLLCNYTDNFTIVVAPLPPMNLNANATTLCAYDTLLLNATGAPSYAWSGPVALSAGSAQQEVLLPLTGTYQVVGTSIEGCQDSVNLSIIVHSAPLLELTPDQGICPSFSATLEVSGATTYTWNEPLLSGTTIQVSPSQTTLYSVVGANIFGCIDSASTTVTVYPQPSANFTASPLILTNDDPTVSFSSYAVNAITSIWDFGDGTILESSQNQFDYTYPFVEDQTYTVTLHVESAEGCTTESQVQIQIKGGIIYYIPNTFTPDGDALNNVFKPIFTSGFDPKNYHLTIFNRWGHAVFESYDPKGGWDGKIDIYDAPEGTYTYSIDFKTLNTDEIINVSGHVTLLR